MPNVNGWSCIYTSDSLIEANLIRSYLESKQIPVAIYSIPTAQLHDYLHDKQEQVRIFVQSTRLQEIQASIQQIVQSNRQDFFEEDQLIHSPREAIGN